MSAAKEPIRKRAGNPFRVYPIATLQSVDDVYSWTINTAGVGIVSTKITHFKQQFLKRGEEDVPVVPLVLGVSGPPGSGKTHLILYSRGKLERELLPIGVALLLRGAEMSWERFYTTVFAAALRELNLYRLFTELLARDAIVVANGLSATVRQAQAMAEKPGRVFEFLRLGELSPTDVERRYRASLETLCPDGSADLKAVLGSLHKRELGRIALEWLGGGTLEAADLQRLGASRSMQPVIDAAPALGALAAVCERLNRVFMFCIDELERLTDWRPPGAGDPRLPDRTNIEWLRKVAEAIASRGGVLIFAGQPRAWAQPVDVIDRLSFRPLIELTVWDTDKVRELVRSAGSAWAERWAKDAHEAVVTFAGGNIRRIQTLLFELFARTVDDDENQEITVEDVRGAAQRLYRPDRRPDLLDPIARAAESSGGSVQRNVAPIEGLVLDLLVRKTDIPHLTARRITVGDEGELARSCVETWQHLNRLRQEKGYNLHALLIVQGATDAQVIAKLDRYDSVTVIDGEAPDAEDKARAATLKRMAEPAETGTSHIEASATDLAVTDEALEIAERSEQAKLVQRTQLAAAYPELTGAQGPLAQGGLDILGAEASGEELARTRIVQNFAKQAEAFLPRGPFALRATLSVSPMILIGAILWLLVLLPFPLPFESEYTNVLISRLIIAVAVLIFPASFVVWRIIADRKQNQARLARRTAFNVIHELMLRGASAAELARARTQLESLVFNDTVSMSAYDEIRGRGRASVGSAPAPSPPPSPSPAG
jgi:hypothetical protein